MRKERKRIRERLKEKEGEKKRKRCEGKVSCFGNNGLWWFY